MITALAPGMTELAVLSAEDPMAQVAPGRDGPRYAATLRHLGGSGCVLVARSDRQLRAELGAELARWARLLAGALPAYTVGVVTGWRGRHAFEAVRRRGWTGGVYAVRSADPRRAGPGTGGLLA